MKNRYSLCLITLVFSMPPIVAYIGVPPAFVSSHHMFMNAWNAIHHRTSSWNQFLKNNLVYAIPVLGIASLYLYYKYAAESALKKSAEERARGLHKDLTLTQKLKGDLEDDLKFLQKILLKLESEMEQLSQQHDLAKHKLKNISQEYEHLQAKLRNTLDKIDHVKNQLRTATVGKEVLTEELRDLNQQKRAIEQELQLAQQTIKNKREELNDVTKNMQKLSEENKLLAEQLTELQTAHSALRSQLDQLNQQKTQKEQDLQNALSEKKQKEQDLEKALDEQKRLKERLQSMMSESQYVQAALLHQEGQHQEASRAKLQEMASLQEQLDKKQTNVENLWKELQIANNAALAKQEEINKTQENIAELNKEIKKMSDTVSELQRTNIEREHAVLTENLTSILKICESQISFVSKMYNEFAKKMKLYNAAIEVARNQYPVPAEVSESHGVQYAEYMEHIKKYDLHIKTMQDDMSNIQKKVQQLIAEKKPHETIKKEIDDFSEQFQEAYNRVLSELHQSMARIDESRQALEGEILTEERAPFDAGDDPKKSGYSSEGWEESEDMNQKEEEAGASERTPTGGSHFSLS